MNPNNTIEIDDNPIERYYYKKHLKGQKWATHRLLELGIGDNYDSHSVVGEW